MKESFASQQNLGGDPSKEGCEDIGFEVSIRHPSRDVIEAASLGER